MREGGRSSQTACAGIKGARKTFLPQRGQRSQRNALFVRCSMSPAHRVMSSAGSVFSVAKALRTGVFDVNGLTRAAAFLAALLAAASGCAQQYYPERPVRMVIAFGPGGIAD